MSSSSKKKRGNKAGEQSARSVARSVLESVLVKGRSLATARSLVHDKLEARERALAMELVNGVLRGIDIFDYNQS